MVTAEAAAGIDRLLGGSDDDDADDVMEKEDSEVMDEDEDEDGDEDEKMSGSSEEDEEEERRPARKKARRGKKGWGLGGGARCHGGEGSERWCGHMIVVVSRLMSPWSPAAPALKLHPTTHLRDV